MLSTVVLGSRSIYANVADIYPFFEHHGSSIAMLDVSEEFQCDLSMVIPHCPSIKSIMLPIEHAHHLKPVLSKLCFIGLDLLRALSGGGDLRLLCRTMDIFLNGHGTGLQAVRLSGIPPGPELFGRFRSMPPEGWEKWINELRAKGIRFEFDGGAPVEILLDEMMRSDGEK
jgi:hypothetical protein